MSISIKTGFGVALLSGGLVLSAGAQQPTLPDAQVEANVLRALASAPELATQNIQSTTVYGVVTLSGSANDEGSRTKAENLVARAQGVKKVVDQMSIGPSVAADAQNGDPGANGPDPAEANMAANGVPNANGMVLQSDGTYAPATGGQALPPPPGSGQAGPPPQGDGYPAPNGQYPQGQDPRYAQNAYPQGQPNGNYPPNGYPQNGPRQGNGYGPQGYQQGAYPVQGGQVAGRPVVIPAGAMVRIRINQGLSSKHTAVGSIFDGTVLNDVAADGAIAIPRGAAVQGVVVDAKQSGAIKGRSGLALQLTRLNLGGQSYSLVSDVWSMEGPDKTHRTVGNAIGLGVLGALVGGAAGGGAGAAIGAGVGAGAGVASSAGSPSGRVIVPAEAVLTFHLTQPAPVATVSEQDMERLSYNAGPVGPRSGMRYRQPQPVPAPYPY